jgi:hypothetical protein
MSISVESAAFEPLAEPPVPEWIIRVAAKGNGFVVRAVPVSARVGEVPVEGLLIDEDAGGFTGYLSSVPPDGAHLFVGYGPDRMVDTDIAFEAPNA